MRVFKKGLVIVLVLAMAMAALYPVLQQVTAVEYIEKPSDLRGLDYTNSEGLAKVLEEVFAGDIDIYSDAQYTKEVSMPVGTSMSNSTLYYAKSQTTGNQISGWQCYIYANAVYNKLFREWVRHAETFVHSRVVIPGGSNTVSYQMLKDAAVRCGAYLRTTDRADGSYSSNVGHSMIILAYDSENITYLEGNGDGKGLIRVVIRSWSDFNLRQLSGRGRYISHIVQPTDVFYDNLYPSCSHDAYEGIGVCGSCGYIYDWEGTLNPWAQGTYRVTEQVTPRRDAPYENATAAELTLKKDQKIQAIGQYRNAFDQVWYKAQDEKGNVFYINGASVILVECPSFQVTCSGFSPVNGAVLEQKSYPVKGTVTSNTPLKSVSGYLDGQLYATWQAANETTVQVDLRQTDLNHKLSFAKLEGGRHRVKVVAVSLLHGQSVTIHESEFFTLSPDPCNHAYQGTVTRDATCTQDGLLTYICDKCDDTYTRTVTAYGHDYQSGVCTRCADKLALSALTGKLLSAGKPGDPVTVTLTQDQVQVYTADFTSNSYEITGIEPGCYTFTATKAGCAPLTAELTVAPGTVVQDVKLCAYGDVSGDHSLNMGDMSALYAHIRGTRKLVDYALLCADHNGDGMINMGDVVSLYAFLRT